MKKKEKKEIKQEETIPTFEFAPINNSNDWLLGILMLLMLETPKSESKTTINIYTGSGK